eukprot:256612-Rhodomonas_salina.1
MFAHLGAYVVVAHVRHRHQTRHISPSLASFLASPSLLARARRWQLDGDAPRVKHSARPEQVLPFEPPSLKRLWKPAFDPRPCHWLSTTPS